MTEQHDLEQQMFAMLMASQFWTADEMQSYQRGQLAQLLRHARANAPFYESRLDGLFRPDGEIDWDRWTDVPILRRADLTAHGEALMARRLPPGHGKRGKVTTSGSSGEPVTVWWSTMGRVPLNANRFRSYRWHDIDWRRVCCSVTGEERDHAAWPNGEELAPWGPAWDPASRLGRMLRINRLESQEHKLDFLARTGTAYLTTGPSAGLALALDAERLGISVRLDAFLPHGAMVGDIDKAAVKRVFGARTAELYSSKEAGNIAHGCPTHEGLHVNAESMLVEIVDEAGRPVEEGPGRVVVTPFFSSAQPLIRYDQGDIASWAGPCPCGRHLPRLSGLIGRITTIFYHPDGRVRSAFMGMHRPMLAAAVWQVAQIGPTRFEVRYVPLDPAVPGDEAGLAAKMREIYFEDAEIQFQRVDRIEPLPNGKPLEYVNEWMPETKEAGR